MSPRPKHPKKELEKVLLAAEAQGWRVEKTRKYYKMYCPCGEHIKTVHLSPSDPNYQKNLLAELLRKTCWKGAR